MKAYRYRPILYMYVTMLQAAAAITAFHTTVAETVTARSVLISTKGLLQLLVAT